MTLAAFGAAARDYAAQCPSSLPAVIADAGSAAEALAEAVERKRRGELFYGIVLLEEPRSAVALALAPHLLRSSADFESRRTLFGQMAAQQLVLDGKAQASITGYPAPLLAALRDFMLCSDTLLVRSWHEYGSLVQWLERSPASSARAAVGRPLPAFAVTARPRSVVVWAPRLHAASAALFAFALEELRIPVCVVCRSPQEASAFGLRANFIEESDAAPALADALAVLVADPSDPGDALALSASGLPLAVAGTSGAHEYLDGLSTFDVWSIRSILFATQNALAGNAPRRRVDASTIEHLATTHSLEATLPPVPTAPPLVTVFLPTLNRRTLLPRALESVRRQRYPNVELLLVNDGGENVDDLAADFPNVRIVNHDAPHGVLRSMNEAVALARGKYFVGLADDDLLFADYISRTVAALERTGAECARALTIVMLLRPGAEMYETIGHSILWDVGLDPTETRSFSNVGSAGVVIRTEALAAAGGYDLTMGSAADYDLQLTLLERGDMLCLKAVGVAIEFRHDKSQWGFSDNAAGTDVLARIFSKHPAPPGRPAMLAGRERWLADLRASGGETPPQPNVALDPPRPEHALFTPRNGA